MTIKKGLFTAANVIHGDGNWTAGASGKSLTCGRVFSTIGICDPGDLPNVPDAGETGHRIEPFAVYAAQRFNYRCTPKEYMPSIYDALDAASEYLIGKVLWGGAPEVASTWDGEVHLASPDVHTMPSVADPFVTLARLRETAFDRHPDLTPTLHLGELTAMRLGLTLNTLGLDYVVSRGYPIEGMAVTGPITIHIGKIEMTEQPIIDVNRFVVEATRLASLDFDMCAAVRAGGVV